MRSPDHLGKPLRSIVDEDLRQDTYNNLASDSEIFSIALLPPGDNALILLSPPYSGGSTAYNSRISRRNPPVSLRRGRIGNMDFLSGLDLIPSLMINKRLAALYYP